MEFSYDDLELFLSNRLSSKAVRKQYKRAILAFCSTKSNLSQGSKELKSEMDSYITTLPSQQRSTTSAALHILFEFITNERYSHKNKPEDYTSSKHIDIEVAAFYVYLQDNTFLAESTIDSAVSTVRHFLCVTFSIAQVDLSTIDEQTVLNFLFVDKKHLKIGSKKALVSRLRRYARYLVDQGYDNAKRVLYMPLNAPNWSQTGIPKTLSLSQISTIKETASTSKRAPLRNMAIISCLANLGLRTCEVAALKLDDIDFHEGTLTIKESKSGTVRTLPLDHETGTLIEKYITKERPLIDGVLFLRHLHDIGSPMGTVNMRMTLRNIARRSGVESFSPHMLRHTVASRMVNGGTPLKIISDVLGHESIQSTTIYAKVDNTHLRFVCASWPGDDNE